LHKWSIERLQSGSFYEIYAEINLLIFYVDLRTFLAKFHKFRSISTYQPFLCHDEHVIVIAIIAIDAPLIIALQWYQYLLLFVVHPPVVMAAAIHRRLKPKQYTSRERNNCK